MKGRGLIMVTAMDKPVHCCKDKYGTNGHDGEVHGVCRRMRNGGEESEDKAKPRPESAVDHAASRKGARRIHEQEENNGNDVQGIAPFSESKGAPGEDGAAAEHQNHNGQQVAETDSEQASVYNGIESTTRWSESCLVRYGEHIPGGAEIDQAQDDDGRVG